MKLAGITKRGRERIKRDGADGWTIQRTEDRVAFSSDRGPWLLVIPACLNEARSRWIHESRDPNFEIVEK
jgi:hypothetical protein